MRAAYSRLPHAACAMAAGVLIAARQLGNSNLTAVRSVWTAMATTLHPAGAALSATPAAGHASSSNTHGPGGRGASASRIVAVSGDEPVFVVTALADNLVEGNAHDPAGEAAARARAVRPADVIADAAAYWQRFWAKSSVSLPGFPMLEDFWHGARAACVPWHTTACYGAA